MRMTTMIAHRFVFSIIFKKFLKNNFLILNFINSTAADLVCNNYKFLTLQSKSFLNTKTVVQKLDCIINTIKKLNYVELDLIGLGYRFSMKKRIIRLNLGYSHVIFIKLPKLVFCLKRKNKILLYSLFKQHLYSLVAQLLHFKKINVYKLKGLKRRLEVIKLKPGKRTK